MQHLQPTAHNPKFGIIAPTAYLEQFASQSTFHLVLAHIVDEDPTYTNFYKKESEKGSFIVCDNGAFEKGIPYEPDKLCEIGKKCGAHCLVLPDYPFEDYTITIKAAKDRVSQFQDNEFYSMFVPQSKRGDLNGLIRSYEWAAWNTDIDAIGISILAAPNALPHLPPVYARVVFTQLLVEKGLFNYGKYHHYLGSNGGVGLEIDPLIKMECLSSCDSSNPVWHGILGHEYSFNSDSLLYTKKIHMPVQFDYPMTRDTDTLRRIQHNLDLTFEMYRNAEKTKENY